MRSLKIPAVLFLFFLCNVVLAGTQGSISGVVFDDAGNPVSSAPLELLSSEQKPLQKLKASVTGNFEIFPLDFGDYIVRVEVAGFAPSKTEVHVASGARSQVAVHLSKDNSKEMLLEVKAKKRGLSNSSAVSSTEVNKDRIATLPMGQEIKLPKLLQTTTPGVVEGPFGQSFIRGNHANIQYQIDGVQLPDSPSNTFGETFSPRNIDHMEVITGGVPAEYGERLAAVVNIITKTGAEQPGGNAELNYGSYNTTSDSVAYGGSSASGELHYYLSANYNRSDRGLDTPQPQIETIQSQGGQDAVHDQSNGNNEFAKLDWIADNDNKYTMVLFNAQSYFQIPNYPSSFLPTDQFFQPTYIDPFGNGPFSYAPSYTDDSQNESNDYVELVWKHSFSSDAFLQLAPYWKYSYIGVKNDQANDLASFALIPNTFPSSFNQSRATNNVGLKGDYTYRQNESNLWKTGFQGQFSQSTGAVTIISYNPTLTTTTDNSPSTGYFESIYVQDDFTISKQFILNAGIRFDSTQFTFSNASSNDYQFGPRVGLSYLPTETTKIHAFYGRLFQPAPVEDLRDSFINSGGGSCPQGQLCPYDIKAEKDDYFEVGVAQAIGDEHFLALNVYYKSATNMLDDNQLLNTSIAQPFNYSNGYAEGAELSLNGRLSPEITDYVNYSYEIAKGEGISGGIFSFQQGQAPPANSYLFLDHVQIHTVNSGATYAKENYWFTLQALYGSGLRTGPYNNGTVPPHTTMDGSVGYKFHGEDWYTKFKLSLDVTNIFNNVYPITIANGFNGSHYAAGSQIFLHLNKDL